MIAVDSSVWIDYLQGKKSKETDLLQRYISTWNVCIAPAAVAELLSNPNPLPHTFEMLQRVRVLEILENYWQRAGLLGANIRKSGLKANLGDALIAQSCIDHHVPLLTSDPDFRHYVKAGGLKLAK